MTFLKESIIYGLSNGLIALFQFGMTLLFSSLLGPVGFGNFSIFLVCYMAFSMLIGMGLSAAVQRSYFEMSTNDFKVLLSTVIKSIIYFTLLVVLVILISPISITKYFLLPKKWILYSVITSTGQIFIQLILIVLQSQRRTFNYLFFIFLQLVILFTSAIIFSLSTSVNWEYAIFAQSVTPIITGVVVIFFLLRDGCSANAWSTKLIREALAYSFPLVPHQLSSWVMTMADRFIIGYYFGVAHVGVYSLSFQIAQSYNIVSNSLNQAVIPILFRKLAATQLDSVEIKKINLMYMLGLLLFLCVFIVVFLYSAKYFIEAEYKSVTSYTPLILISFFFLAASRIGANYLMYNNKTKILSYITLVSSVLSISLNFLLVPLYGEIAACWVSVCTFLILFLITNYYAYLNEVAKHKQC